jgi:hypothetical protein
MNEPTPQQIATARQLGVSCAEEIDAQMNCECSICTSRMARGEPSLAGISISPAAHVTQNELPERRRPRVSKSPATFQPAVSPPVVTVETIRSEIRKFVDGVLAEAMGTALGAIMREKSLRRAGGQDQQA